MVYIERKIVRDIFYIKKFAKISMRIMFFKEAHYIIL